MVTRWSRST